jgi:hypothetical protein
VKPPAPRPGRTTPKCDFVWAARVRGIVFSSATTGGGEAVVVILGGKGPSTRSAGWCSLCGRSRRDGSGYSVARGDGRGGVEQFCCRFLGCRRPEADLAEAGGGELEGGQRVGAVGVSDAGVGGGRGARVRGRGGGEGVVWWTCGRGVGPIWTRGGVEWRAVEVDQLLSW